MSAHRWSLDSAMTAVGATVRVAGAGEHLWKVTAYVGEFADVATLARIDEPTATMFARQPRLVPVSP